MDAMTPKQRTVPRLADARQLVEQRLGPTEVGGAEEIQMVEHVVELIERSAALVARVERPVALISGVELRAEAAEELRHGEVCFAIAIVSGRIEDDRFAPMSFVDDAAPVA